MSDASSLSLQFVAPVPDPFASSCRWILGADGIFLYFDGEAADIARSDLGGRFKGRDYRDVFHDAPAITTLLAGALAGEIDGRRVSWRGREWFTLVQPVCDGPRVVAASGASLLLPPGMTAAEAEDGGLEEWVCLAPIRHTGLILRPNDVLIRNGRLWTRTHVVPGDVAEEVTRSEGSRLRRVSAPAPPSSGSLAAPTSGRPPLQLVE